MLRLAAARSARRYRRLEGLVQAGVGVDALPLAGKPNVVVALAASAPLYEALRTVMVDPLALSVPFQPG